MKKIREALRLHEVCGLSLRKTAQIVQISRPVLTDYLTRCRELSISYEKATELSDDRLLALFVAEPKKENSEYERLLSLFPGYVRELSRPGVTRQLLWEEYRSYQGTYSYSQFCYHFQKWSERQDFSMIMEHKAGDKIYVDFTGKKLKLVDPGTGEITEVEVFVASLGASKLIYAEAVRSQKKQDFICANVNAFEYIGGVPQAIVPDCLKSAVTKGDRYEAQINPEYSDFALHYGTTILAARPYKPKDKALVEGSVKIVYQRIFAPLRDRVFHSLDELNVAIRDELEKLNNRSMQQYEKSRWKLFNEIEQEYLSPLPLEPYQYREYRKLKVQCNYHVYLNSDKHYYSVPYRFIKQQVELFVGPKTVEIFHNNERIALHKREFRKYNCTTDPSHMPPQHRYKDNWNPDKLLSWGGGIGEHVQEVVDVILSSKAHPEQGYKSCMGVLNLKNKYGKKRLNSACKRALIYEVVSYRSIKNMLENNVEELEQEKLFPDYILPSHENIRGKEYYTQEQMQ